MVNARTRLGLNVLVAAIGDLVSTFPFVYRHFGDAAASFLQNEKRHHRTSSNATGDRAFTKRRMLRLFMLEEIPRSAGRMEGEKIIH